MKKNQILSVGLMLFAVQTTWAQINVPNIKEADVSRIIKTLSADDMKGRSALKPEDIGKAADFISTAFKNAGLK
ncbi:MAG: peptidase M28, partial [Bacteroidetes bacterium]|nr:peptidase M28 [Bacteroidota bacterium]